MSEAVEDAYFCLEKFDSVGSEVYCLKRDHSYYYQVRQLHHSGKCNDWC